jgi:hypothetical protein
MTTQLGHPQRIPVEGIPKPNLGLPRRAYQAVPSNNSEPPSATLKKAVSGWLHRRGYNGYDYIQVNPVVLAQGGLPNGNITGNWRAVEVSIEDRTAYVKITQRAEQG